MKKITGIRNVDFIIHATGEGVVNHNGSSPVYNPAAKKVVENHMFPKLRGFDPTRRVETEHEGELQARSLRLDDPALESARLVVSPNTLKYHLFRFVASGLSRVTTKNSPQVLASMLGLLGGYLITQPGSSFPRKAPLYLTALECNKPGLYFNQGSNAGARDKNSLFSYFGTDSNLKYVGMGSISIEDLQFIPLEHSNGRSAVDLTVTEARGREIAREVTAFLQDLGGECGAEAVFVKNAVRKGALCPTGEAGLLLNEEATHLLVEETLSMLRDLDIRQGKGHLSVTSVDVDYNDGRAFRMFRDPTVAMSQRGSRDYAMYYEDRAQDAEVFEQKMNTVLEEAAARKKELEATNAAKADKKARAKAKTKSGAGKAPPESEATATSV